MTEASDQANARARLGWILHVLRPDWDMAGIERYVEGAGKLTTLGELCRFAIDAALTPSTKTPAGIVARVRDGWTAGAVQERPTRVFSGPQFKPCRIPRHVACDVATCDWKPYVAPSADSIRAARDAARSAQAHPNLTPVEVSV